MISVHYPSSLIRSNWPGVGARRRRRRRQPPRQLIVWWTVLIVILNSTPTAAQQQQEEATTPPVPENTFYIGIPEFIQSNVNLTLVYPVADSIPFENLDYRLFDGTECGNEDGTGSNDITGNTYLLVEQATPAGGDGGMIGDGTKYNTVSLQFTYDTSTIRSSPIFIENDALGSINFCVQFISYTANILDPLAQPMYYRETFITLDILQGGDTPVTGVIVQDDDINNNSDTAAGDEGGGVDADGSGGGGVDVVDDGGGGGGVDDDGGVDNIFDGGVDGDDDGGLNGGVDDDGGLNGGVDVDDDVAGGAGTGSGGGGGGLYQLVGYLCDRTNEEVTNPDPIFLGMPIRVCVTPDEIALSNGVTMRAIESFAWVREDDDSITQGAISPTQVVNPLTTIDCSPGMRVCAITTFLRSTFFYRLGNATGAGVGWLQVSDSFLKDVIVPMDWVTDTRIVAEGGKTIDPLSRGITRFQFSLNNYHTNQTLLLYTQSLVKMTAVKDVVSKSK
jgi:hypothetical protein